MRKGRFHKAVADVAQRYSESVSFDRRLYRHDIAGSIAHVAALAKAGIVSAAEQKKIESELRQIEKEIESGKFQWDQSLEDIHMNIENALTKKIGDTSANLLAARSRNDQGHNDLCSRLSRVSRHHRQFGQTLSPKSCPPTEILARMMKSLVMPERCPATN